MKKHIAGLLLVLPLSCELLAQNPRPVVPLPQIREADVIWSKRIWRVIDVREKLNLSFYFPNGDSGEKPSLFDVIKTGVFRNEIKAFKNDELIAACSGKDFAQIVIKSDSVTVYGVDEEGRELEFGKMVHDTLSSEEILQYWVKEDWFFDKQRSVMDVRISAICPVKYDEFKEMYIPLFWIPYNESREWLNSFSVINPQNNAEERTYDELFIKRKFSSYISKESNIYDRSIEEYAEGTDAQNEADRIKNQLRNFEHDMWQY
jgi:gliding motility associated protien GldN